MKKYINNDIFSISAYILFIINIINFFIARYMSADRWWVNLLMDSNTPPPGYTYSFFIPFSLAFGVLFYISYKLICLFVRWLINWKPLPDIYNKISYLLFSFLCICNMLITYGVFTKSKNFYLETKNYEFVKIAASQYYTVLLIFISIITIVFISILVHIYKINRCDKNNIHHDVIPNSNSNNKILENLISVIIIIISFFLILFMYSGNNISYNKNDKIEESYSSDDVDLLKIKNFVTETNKKLPIIISDGIRSDHVSYKRYAITNEYTLLYYSSDTIKDKKYKTYFDNFKINIIMNACNEKEMNYLMNKYDMTYWYIYYGNDQIESLKFYVDKNICKKY